MAMNRRNVLIGMGAATAGGGALIATGAFTTVEAQRTVQVDTADDSEALLGLIPNDETDLVHADEDVLEIDLSEDNLSAEGVNLDATTTIEPGFGVQNNGSQFVDIDITEVSDGDITVSFIADADSLDGDSDVDLSNNIVRVEDGQGFDVNVIVEVDGTDPSESLDEDATITATASDDDTDPEGDDGFVTDGGDGGLGSIFE